MQKETVQVIWDTHGKPWKVAHPEWYDEYGRLIKDFGDDEGIDPRSCEGLGQG